MQDPYRTAAGDEEFALTPPQEPILNWQNCPTGHDVVAFGREGEAGVAAAATEEEGSGRWVDDRLRTMTKATTSGGGRQRWRPPPLRLRAEADAENCEGGRQVARVDGIDGSQGRSEMVVAGSSLPTDAILWGGIFYIY